MTMRFFFNDEVELTQSELEAEFGTDCVQKIIKTAEKQLNESNKKMVAHYCTGGVVTTLIENDKSGQELRKRAIDLLVFNYTSEFGIRRNGGEKNFEGAVSLMKQLFGDEEYDAIATEAMKLIDITK